MKDQNQTEMQLINELAELRKRIAELKTLENERKQTEEALRKSEERYRTLFEESRDAIYTTSQEGEIIDANQSMLNLFGYSRGEMIGLQARETYVHPEDRLKFKQKIEHEGFVRDHEIKLRKKDGTEMDCLLTAIVRRTADGNILGYQGIIRDITESKRAEEKLRAISDRYRSYIEVTGQLGWTTNADGEIEEDIPSWRRYTGQDYEEIKGWGWSKAIHPDDLERTIQVWTKAVTTKSTYEVEYRLRRYDGVYQYFLARGVPVFKEDGNIREWVGTCIEITERKRAEEALKGSEQRLADIIDFLPDATLVIDREGKIIAWNHAMEAMLGVKAKDMLGKGNCEYAIPFYGERRPILIDLVTQPQEEIDKRYAHMEKRPGGVLMGESYIPNLKGGEFYFFGAAAPLYDQKGNLVGAIECIRDITERKRLEEEREKLIRELQDALANIKTLHGLLPICSYCKKIRDDKGYWNRIESYIQDHSGAEFTHGMCPECLKKLYPDFVD
jgi:PAS domain S-box-containing protein